MDNRLEFGSAFSRVFDLYGKYFAPLLIWAAVVQFGIALLIAIVFTAAFSGNVGAAILAGAVTVGFSILASAILTGAYVIGVDEAERTGTFPSFGETWAKVSPRIGALIVTSIIAALGIMLGVLLLVIPALILMTWWAVFAPVVMLEGTSGGEALGRSRELVRGHGWTVFGLIIVMSILTGIGSNIISAIVGGILGGSDEFLGIFGGEFVSGTLLTPISALLAVVMYHALRGSADGGHDQLDAPAADPMHQPRPPADPPASSGPFV